MSVPPLNSPSIAFVDWDFIPSLTPSDSESGIPVADLTAFDPFVPRPLPLPPSILLGSNSETVTASLSFRTIQLHPASLLASLPYYEEQHALSGETRASDTKKRGASYLERVHAFWNIAQTTSEKRTIAYPINEDRLIMPRPRLPVGCKKTYRDDWVVEVRKFISDNTLMPHREIGENIGGGTVATQPTQLLAEEEQHDVQGKIRASGGKKAGGKKIYSDEWVAKVQKIKDANPYISAREIGENFGVSARVIYRLSETGRLKK